MVTNHLEIKGNQRLAVLKAMLYPASGSYLFDRAKKEAKTLTYFDLRKILKDFISKELIYVLNPNAGNGKIYSLTPLGHHTFIHHFKFIPISRTYLKADINLLSKTLRRLLSKKILNVISTEPSEQEDYSINEIRKLLLNTHPTSYNNVFSNVQTMVDEKLIEVNEVEHKGHIEKRYFISELGKEVEKEIRRIRAPPNSPYRLQENSLVNHGKLYHSPTAPTKSQWMNKKKTEKTTS